MDTRQKIMDATHRLLKERGLARLTSKAIAQESGFAEGTIFKHFGTKDRLLLSVVREQIPAFTTVASADRAGRGTVHDNLVQIGLAAIVYTESLIPIAAGVLADADLLARQREVLPPHGPARNFQHVADYIAAEQGLGRIDRSVDPLAVAQLLIGSCFQWAFFRQLLGTAPLPLADEELVRRIV